MLSVWDKNYRIRPKGPLKAIQPTERPNLKGKEIITNVNVIKHSLKRSREVEASPDTKSDTELSSLYNTENTPSKKHRPSIEKENQNTEEDDCSVGILTSLLDEEDVTRNDDSESVNSDSSGNCYTSIKEDDRQDSASVTEDLTEKDSHSVTLTEESIVSENPCEKSDLIEPSEEDITEKSKSDGLGRNRFAVHSKSKERFNINATKVEVKSRFFAKSTSPVQSKMEITSPDRPKVDKLAFKTPNQYRFERNRLSSMDKNSLSISSEEIMQKGRTSSNASAFSWRQQQFVRNQSMDNFSALKSGSQQTNLNQQFQVPGFQCNPLVRHNSDGGSRIGGGRDSNNRSMPVPENDNYATRNHDNDCGVSDINQSVTASTFFNMSRCPSMNLSESPGSQEDDAEPGSQKHTPVNSPIDSWIGSTETMHLPNFPPLPSLHVVCPAFLNQEAVKANSPMPVLDPNLLDSRASRTCSPSLPILKAPSRCLHRCAPCSPFHQARTDEHTTSAPVSPQISRSPRRMLAENFSVTEKE